MVRNGIKTLMIMPGGWHYDQPLEAGGHIRIDGQTYEQLEDRVFEFRLSNVEVVRTGTAERSSVALDLNRWICSRFPDQCAGPALAPAPEPKRENGRAVYNRPIERIQDWFKAVTDIAFVDAATAGNRAAICAGCSQNSGWKTPCAPCVERVERQLTRTKGSKATQLDPKLNFCRVFGHHNLVAVWLKDTRSAPMHEVPDYCWNKG